VTASLHLEGDRLLAAYRGGRPLVLLFDYDGTLVPIVEHPSQAQLAAGTRQLLERLAGHPRLAVGILSGRMLDDLKAMVGLPGLHYAGNSGLELELNGARSTPPGATEASALIADLAAHLDKIAAQHAGAWVENKRLGLALHYRAVDRQQIPDLQARARQILQLFAARLRILDVAMAIEITPALGVTKGTAVRRMVAHAGPGALPFYAGDDANDRDALEAATALGGLALGIGPRAPSVAHHRLPDPAALMRFLDGFLQALESGGHCSAARPLSV
jgi:trehalose 6-phosphate phosphatase